MTKYFGDDDLIMNTASRLPVCLCLDSSGSMYDCVDELEDSVNMFYKAVREDEQASLSCEIAVVTFDSTVHVLEDYSTVDKKSPIKIDVNGSTDMTSGVKKALDLLEERKLEYKRNGVDYYQPWLVVMTDGYPDDKNSLEQLQEKIRMMEASKKITVFAIAIGDDCDMSILDKFSKRRAIKLKNNNFQGFFEWLGKSVSAVSMSQVGEKVKLDTSTMDEWAEI